MASKRPSPAPRIARAAGASILVVLSLALLVAPAQAREWSAGDKFGRGVTNMTLGVLAWPGEMVTESRERGPALGVPLGFATGLGWFVAREIIGVYEFLTCVFPAPPGFRPIIEPEHPWQTFDARPSRRR